FQKLFNQGMILAYSYKDKNGAYVHVDNVQKNGDGTVTDKRTGEPLTMQIEKMSKSRGNVVNPDDVVRELGADSLRLYEMFMGPLDQVKPWDTAGVAGVNRFLTKCWKLLVSPGEEDKLHERVADIPCDSETEMICHQTIRKVGEDIENLSFNTAISQMMIFINHLSKLDKVPKAAAETLVLVLAPYAPHLAEELWAILGHKDCVSLAPWPKYDPAKCEISIIKIAVQVLGKMRGTVEIDKNAPEDELIEAAKKIPAVARQLEGKTIRKTIVVPGRIVNFIAN
ncbi:MAG: class I tRNA ligase family protein, partial [Proteobacteria bacterium]|nr:class I tRNA ligase family protein [Pseudomonadota bacterium]